MWPAVLWANALAGKPFLIPDADTELAFGIAGAVRVTRNRRQVRVLRMRHRDGLQCEFSWCGVAPSGELRDRHGTPPTKAGAKRPDTERFR